MIFLTRFVYFYCFVERNSHSNFVVNGQHFLIHDTIQKEKNNFFTWLLLKLGLPQLKPI